MAKNTSTSAPARETPLMQQYYKLKAQYRDAVLLFRVGDFYETFGEDAIRTAAATGIVLTRRNNGGSDIELAGFPFHSLDIYMPKLVRAGLRVAICEQLEKPGKEKKIVRRGVTEVITPGVTTDNKLLDHKSNNYLASVFLGKHERYGIAFADISTGEFTAAEGDTAYLTKLIQHFQPSEILLTKSQDALFKKHLGESQYTYHLEEWVFTQDYARDKLQHQFSVQNLKGFGIEELPYGQIAAGAILHYLGTTENAQLGHFRTISRIQSDEYVWLDQFTVRNLELVHCPSPQGKSLLQVLDDTTTAMGARMVRHWVQMPLLSIPSIQKRQAIVRYLMEDLDLRDHLAGHLREIGDLERLLARAVVGKINPREMNQLARALELTSRIQKLLVTSSLDHLKKKGERLNPCHNLISEIRATMQVDPPALLAKGEVIKDGCDQDLDDLRNIIRNSKDILVQVQLEESQRTGIPNLKIGFNSVFGYYLEVTNKYKNQNLIPDTWIRKQTTTNGERYITEELKRLEERILGAEDKILARETSIYEALTLTVQDYIEPIQSNAQLLAQLDVLLGFSRISLKRNYVCPELDDSLTIELVDCRHPVIEVQLPPGEQYIPNDIYMDPEQQQVLMITGPNMSGKSAILRQTALICLMAQMGCFVPASKARLGIVDKVFTRVGASDNISSGESTFMVEMSETASIMNNISQRSLILLDEIGRGTATYDGISIAWAIAEYIHENGQFQPKTLFATHYHELNELSSRFPRIKNFHVATQETGNRVLFLRKLLAGGSEHSFGIHVAQMAGMPGTIVQRAREILKWLESQRQSDRTENQAPSIPSQAVQLSFFDITDPVMQEVRKSLMDLEINQMTPIECMLKLQELKAILHET